MGKVKLETFRNPTHFLILIHLAEKPNNAYGLSLIDSFSKSQSVAYRELIELEKSDYVTQIDTGKNVFKINYKKVFEDFYEFILKVSYEIIENLNFTDETLKNKFSLDDKFSYKYKSKLKNELISEKDFIENLKNNKYLEIFLIEYLKFFQSKSYISTLEQAFQRLVSRDLMLFHGEFEFTFFEEKLGFNNEVLIKKENKSDYVNTFTLNENLAKIRIYENNLEFLEFSLMLNFMSELSLEFSTSYMDDIYNSFLKKDKIEPYIKNNHKPYTQD
jgi:hypothetical protein